MLEAHVRPGNITVPKLSWARRESSEPQQPAHLALVFDSFGRKVDTFSIEALTTSMPLEVYGLVAGLAREFSFDVTPTWKSYIAHCPNG
jgi:hypothetical protein